MIEKTISDKFFGGGLIINPSNSENVRKLDYDTIVELFEKNGVILFRDFNLKPEEIEKRLLKFKALTQFNLDL